MGTASENKTTVQVGPGLVTLLTLVFVYLKVTNQLDWSWVWVLSPIWISVGLSLGLLLLFFGVFAVGAFFVHRQSKRM